MYLIIDYDHLRIFKKDSSVLEFNSLDFISKLAKSDDFRYLDEMIDENCIVFLDMSILIFENETIDHDLEILSRLKWIRENNFDFQSASIWRPTPKSKESLIDQNILQFCRPLEEFIELLNFLKIYPRVSKIVSIFQIAEIEIQRRFLNLNLLGIAKAPIQNPKDYTLISKASEFKKFDLLDPDKTQIFILDSHAKNTFGLMAFDGRSCIYRKMLYNPTEHTQNNELSKLPEFFKNTFTEILDRLNSYKRSLNNIHIISHSETLNHLNFDHLKEDLIKILNTKKNHSASLKEARNSFAKRDRKIIPISQNKKENISNNKTELLLDKALPINLDFNKLQHFYHLPTMVTTKRSNNLTKLIITSSLILAFTFSIHNYYLTSIIQNKINQLKPTHQKSDHKILLFTKLSKDLKDNKFIENIAKLNKIYTLVSHNETSFELTKIKFKNGNYNLSLEYQSTTYAEQLAQIKVLRSSFEKIGFDAQVVSDNFNTVSGRRSYQINDEDSIQSIEIELRSITP